MIRFSVSELEHQLNTLINWRGYVVFGSENVYLPGDIITQFVENDKWRHPLCVLGKTDRNDWLAQYEFGKSRFGLPDREPFNYQYYYRVVTD